MGLAVEALVPEALRSGHIAHRTAYQREPAVRPMSMHLDIRFRRRDGSEFPADIALSPLATDQGVLIVASVRDITERKRQDDRLRAVAEIAQATLEGRREEELLHLIAVRTRALVGSALATVALLDPGAEAVVGAWPVPSAPRGLR